MVEVRTGTADLGYVQIQPINALPAHTRVVTKGAFFLQSQLANAEGGDEGHGH